MSKPEIKISNWYVIGSNLYGQIDEHPSLGLCSPYDVIRTSSIVKIETRNSIYVMDGPALSRAKLEKQMLRHHEDL